MRFNASSTVATKLSTWNPRSEWNPKKEKDSVNVIPAIHIGINTNKKTIMQENSPSLTAENLSLYCMMLYPNINRIKRHGYNLVRAAAVINAYATHHLFLEKKNNAITVKDMAIPSNFFTDSVMYTRTSMEKRAAARYARRSEGAILMMQ